jgi:3-hydroxyacyl-[acyl-carrier-protein] dehydratase
MKGSDCILDVRGIMDLLPHRYPFLLIDRVLELTPDRDIVALKNVTINEPFFVGHFSYHPVMPGVLVIEAMAQAAAILTFRSNDHLPDDKSIYYFVGIDRARFKRPVVPGDQLELRVAITRARESRGLWKFKGEARVAGNLAAEAELLCTLRLL